MTDQRDTRIAELETLLARNLVFDRDSAENAVEALGGWGRMVELVEAHHARQTQEDAT